MLGIIVGGIVVIAGLRFLALRDFFLALNFAIDSFLERSHLAWLWGACMY
jgi:hypothetical protein